MEWSKVDINHKYILKKLFNTHCCMLLKMDRGVKEKPSSGHDIFNIP